MNFKEIPGYKILLGLAVVGLLGFGSWKLATMHHSPFERATGYSDIDEMIAAKVAYEEEVAQSIGDLGGPGDDWTKAGKGGDAAAQYRLGNVYLYGTPSEKQDYVAAMKWFRLSAAQKYAPAMYQIGRMYANSHVPAPGGRKEAVKWYLQSADGGYKWAQIHLGEIYMHFLAEQFGVKHDDAEADFWLTLGTATEEPNSDFIRDRDAAEANLKPDEIIAVKKRVQDWQASHPAVKP